MLNETPLVSVVIPAYNAEKYISEAIDSILGQTFKDFELIIVDDASRDGTGKIIREYAAKDSRIKTFKNETNLKLAKTLNLGIQNARGKYIARMDADDVSLPNRLEIQIKVMENHPEIAILGGAMFIMDQNSKVKSRRNYHLDDRSIRKHIFRYSPFCHPAVIIRKDVFQKTEGYKHEFNPAEDYELYFQLGKLGQFANTKEELIKYRVVKNSMTTGKLKNMEFKTIKVRFKYFKDYGGTPADLMYSLAQLATVYIMPAKFRIWLFTKVRERKV